MKRFIIFISLLFIVQLSFSQEVSLYAGTPGSPGYTSGNTLTNTKFNQPYGLAIDTLGNMWISEIGGHTIRMVTTNGDVYVRAGGYGSSGFYNAAGITSRFSDPRGIAIGPDNSIYIAEYGNHVIRKIEPFTNLGNTQMVSVFAGKFTTGSSTYTSYPGYANGSASVAQFKNPSGLAIDDTGNVYVADYGNHLIRKITPAGNVTTIAGQPGTSGSDDGNAKTKATFNYPSNLIIDGKYLYIVDNLNSSIRKLDLSNSTVSTLINSLWTPIDICMYKGAFYITDQHRVRRYYDNNLITYVGSSTLNQQGYTNGKAAGARFYYAKSILFNPFDTSLYVADMGNHVIRKVTICNLFTPTITLSGNDTFCDGDSVVLSGPAGYSKYFWSNGKTTQSIVVKESATISLTIQGTDSCTGISSSVTITKLKRPTSTFKIKSSECHNINDTIIYTGNGLTTAAYNWYFDSAKVVSGSGQGPIILNWNKAGKRNVELEVTENGCVSYKTSKKIDVYQVPESKFIIDTTACFKINDTITFTGSASTSASYTWNFDGATKVSGKDEGPYVVNWSTTGTKTVSLSITDQGCESSQFNKKVIVNPPPSSTFTIVSSICQYNADSVKYTGSASPTATYTWNFDGGTVQSGTGQGPYFVSWNTTGTKNLKLIVNAFGCLSSEGLKSTQIKPSPTANFKLTKNVCAGLPDTITYTGNGGSSAVYTWDFDGAQIFSGSGKGPFIVYWLTSGQKTIKLQVSENGCNSVTNSQVVEVSDAPDPKFSMKTIACSQESVTITFTGTASSSAIYNWNFNGGLIESGSGKGPYSIKWSGVGLRTVSLYINDNGCSSSQFDQNITIKATPSSLFTSKASICEEELNTITFTGIAGSGATFNWNFDGATVQSGSGKGPYSIKWSNSGSKNITLTVTDAGCLSQETKIPVEVKLTPPIPMITQKGDTLISTSTTDNQWYGSGGLIPGEIMQTFRPLSNGVYYVVVTNSFGCKSQSSSFNYIKGNISELWSKNVEIHPNPATDKLFINLTEQCPCMFSLDIFSTDGRLLIAKKLYNNNEIIDLKDLKEGIYILRVRSDKINGYYQFIKQSEY